jgi:dihydrofolate synthase/folylpolyglutamate synthase
VIAILEDKDASAMLQILEPVLDEVVVSRTTSPRAISPQRLGRLASEIYGEGRVSVVDNLPDALDRAAGLADEGGFGGGVLATGSITTAAEVRMLLGVTGDEGQTAG